MPEKRYSIVIDAGNSEAVLKQIRKSMHDVSIEVVDAQKAVVSFSGSTQSFENFLSRVKDMNAGLRTEAEQTKIATATQIQANVAVIQLAKSYQTLFASMKALQTTQTAVASNVATITSAVTAQNVSVKQLNTTYTAGSSAHASYNSGLLKLVRTVSKLTFLILALRRAFTLVSTAITSSMNYIENLNLFTVALGKNAEKATSFIAELSSSFGMDEASLTRIQGLFYQISHSLGLSSTQAYTLSETFTKLALDLSSLYNISINDAVTKLQAGLVGETEPLRRIGIILTENNLTETAHNLGIMKSIRNMTEQEKIQLRYITALNQTKKAQQDFSRTLDQPANMFRIIKQQMTIVSREIGNVLLPVLTKALPTVLAFTRAVAEMLQAYNKKKNNTASSYLSEASKNVTDVDDAVKDTGASTTKLYKYLKQVLGVTKQLSTASIGIDELNILGNTSNSSSGAFSALESDADDAMNLITKGYDAIEQNGINRFDKMIDSAKTKIEGFILDVTNAFKPVSEALGRLRDTLFPKKSDSSESDWVNVLTTVGQVLAGIVDSINDIATVATTLFTFVYDHFLVYFFGDTNLEGKVRVIGDLFLGWKFSKAFLAGLGTLLTFVGLNGLGKITLPAIAKTVGGAMIAHPAITAGALAFGATTFAVHQAVKARTPEQADAEKTHIENLRATDPVLSTMTPAQKANDPSSPENWKDYSLGDSIKKGISGLFTGIRDSFLKKGLTLLSDASKKYDSSGTDANAFQILELAGKAVASVPQAVTGFGSTDFASETRKSNTIGDELSNPDDLRMMQDYAHATGLVGTAQEDTTKILETASKTIEENNEANREAKESWASLISSTLASVTAIQTANDKFFEDTVTRHEPDKIEKTTTASDNLLAVANSVGTAITNVDSFFYTIYKWVKDLVNYDPKTDTDKTPSPVSGVQKTVNSIISPIGKTLSGASKIFTDVFKNMLNQDYGQVVIDGIKDTIAVIKGSTVIKKIGDSLSSLFKNNKVFSSIGKAFSSIGESLSNTKLYQWLFGTDNEDGKTEGTSVSNATKIANVMTDAFKGVTSAIGQFTAGLYSAYSGTMTAEGTSVYSDYDTSEKSDFVQNALLNTMTSAGGGWAIGALIANSIIDGTLVSFVKDLPEMFKTGVDVVMKIIDGVISAIPQIAEAFPAIIQSIVDNLFSENTLTTLLNSVMIIIMELADALPDMLVTLVEAIPTILQNLFSTIFKSLADGSFLKFGWNLGVKLLEGLAKAVVALIDVAISPFRWLLGLIGIDIPKLASGIDFSWALMADGGFPDQGQMFVAREAGAEMVGSIGGKTAVANNDQIVEAVSSGVYEAVSKALANSNSSQPLNIYLDGKKIYDNQQAVSARSGLTFGTGGKY